MAEPGWPARGAGGADTWQEATQTPVRGATWRVGFAGRVTAHRTSDVIRTATIAWTRVHAIIKAAPALMSLLVDAIGALT